MVGDAELKPEYAERRPGAHPRHRPHRPGVAATRRLLMLGVAAAVFSCLFVLSFGYAQHSPRPHGLRIDVAAPAPVAVRVRRDLDRAVPGGFDVRRVHGELAARNDLRHLDSEGAFAVQPDGALDVLTAGALGVPLQSAVEQALATVAHREGRAPRFIDVVPLPAGDRSGSTAFALELGLLVPGVIGAIGLYLLGRRARAPLRAAAAVAYAVVAGALATVTLDAVLGALTGSPWTLFGDCVLIAATFAFAVVGLHCLLGLQGTAIAAGALFVVGNAVNGAAVPTRMLPDGYRQVAPWLPNNAAVSLVRSSVYFDDHGQASAVVTLAVWLAVALVVIAMTDVLHLRLRRGTSAPAPEIHARSLLSMVRASRTGAPRELAGRP